MTDLDNGLLYNSVHIKRAHKARARYLRAMIRGLWSSPKTTGPSKPKGPAVHGGAAG